jgi:hypothetical protein
MHWLKYSLPGSPRHLTWFQEAGFTTLTNKAQVDQLVKVVVT